MKTVDIRGEIVPNEWAGCYAYEKEVNPLFTADCTCPAFVQDVINTLEDGEELQIIVNSGGGDVMSGSEIHSMLKNASAAGHKTICEIQSIAASAASMIACACDVVKMHSTAKLMIHCASTSTGGNHRDMERMANILSTVDKSIAQAYVEKTGATEAQVLEWMNREEGFWLDANKCVELHFADEVIHNKKFVITNSVCGDLSMTPEQVEKIKDKMEKEKVDAEAKKNAEQAAAISAKVEKIKLKAKLTAMGVHVNFDGESDR